MNKTTKGIAIGAGILIGLIIIILIGGAVLRNKVEKELADMNLGEYSLTNGRVSLNLFRGSLALEDVRLVTDVERRDADTLRRSRIHFVDARIDRIFLQGISLRGLKSGNLSFRSLKIDSPRASIVTGPLPPDSIAPVVETEQALSNLTRIGIRDIRLNDGTFEWQQITESDTLIYHIAGLNAGVETFLLDSTRNSRSRVLFSDQAAGRVDSVRYTFGNGAYTLAIDSLVWNATDQTLSAARTELRPQFSRRDFPRKSVRKSDWMEMEIENLSCLGVDFSALWNEQAVRIDSVHIPSGSFATYKDRQASVPVRIKPMIHTTIQQIGIPLDIRKIKTDDVRAEYLELAVHGTRPGSLVFEHIDATFFGFTNRVRREDQYIELYANAKLMGRGDLTTVISMPVDPANDRFEIKMTLQSMPISALNTMITPLANVEVKSGYINRMDYTLAGSGTQASARMLLLYNNLEVTLVRARPNPNQNRERTGLSNIVNTVLIKPENPDKNGTRSVQTAVVRDKHRSVFNYIWKGVFAGAKETAQTNAMRWVMPD